MTRMEGGLKLHVPSLEELWYRERLMADPDTMSYNRGYVLPFEGYNPQTGCIPFPREQWAEWYAFFINQEPLRYYAYVVRESDGAFLGEVNLHKSETHGWHEMGIVLEARHRGMGYSVPALRLLMAHAFEVMGVEAIHNDFEASRSAATRAHLAAGFSVLRNADGLLELLMTREQYALAQHADECLDGNGQGDPQARQAISPRDT